MHLPDGEPRFGWVQTDRALAWARGLARDGGDSAQEAFWHEWEAEEQPFLAADRPWERADVVVDGRAGAAARPGDGNGRRRAPCVTCTTPLR